MSYGSNGHLRGMLRHSAMWSTIVGTVNMRGMVAANPRFARSDPYPVSEFSRSRYVVKSVPKIPSLSRQLGSTSLGWA